MQDKDLRVMGRRCAPPKNSLAAAIGDDRIPQKSASNENCRSGRILREEAPGVLNWMLEGLEKLRAGNWQLTMSPNQEKTVSDLLLESDSHSDLWLSVFIGGFNCFF